MAKTKVKSIAKKKPAGKAGKDTKKSQNMKLTGKKPVKKAAAKSSGTGKTPVRTAAAKKVTLNGKASGVNKSPGSGEKAKKTKSKYSAKDLKYFKEIILKERKQILESAKANMEALVDYESGEYVGDNSTYSTHMAEQGTDEMEREKNYMFVQRDEKYLGYLNDALIRIDNGTYGICINCRKLIPRERLELVPVTQHCIRCKTMKG